MDKIPYVKRMSRVAAHWKSKSTNGDPTKVWVREIIYAPKPKDRLMRAYLVTSLILTSMPEKYTPQARVARLFKGRALLINEEMHTAETWILISGAVQRLLNEKEKRYGR